MKKRPKIGDILEMATRRGLAYIQITHVDTAMGFLIRVIQGHFDERPANPEALAGRPTQFVTFFPVAHALTEGILSAAGTAGVPVSDRAFPVFRVPGEVDRSGRVLNWLLWDGNTHKNIGQLRPEQRNLPIEGIWNDTLLRERIESEYTPAKDVL